MSSRRDRILNGLKLQHLVGAEVGPLDKPLVAKNQGRVFYIDRSDTETLKTRWLSDPSVDTSALHVDAVWGTASLQDALVEAGAWPAESPGLDYLIGSHVIEHVPDLISWLREVREVLKPQGTLRLAVPDRRYTFDYLRRTSTLAEVVDAFVRKRRTPSGSRVLDFTLNMVEVDCATAWRGEVDEGALAHHYTHQGALALARDAEENGIYHDVHCWVFTPRSFARLMAQLAKCGLLEFACDWLLPTEINTVEFLVSMRPATHAEAEQNWLRLAEDLLRGETGVPQPIAGR